MDFQPPAPGSAVAGAPPALRRALTPEDGVQAPTLTEGERPSPTPGSTEPTGGQATRLTHRTTRTGHEPTGGVNGIPSLSSYLPALGLCCAAAAVWLGSRRRRSAITN